MQKKAPFRHGGTREQCKQDQLEQPCTGVQYEPLESNFCKTTKLISHCETVKCQNVETSTPVEDYKFASEPDVLESEVDIRKQLILSKSSEEPLFPDDTELTVSHFTMACSNFLTSLTISEDEVKKIEIETGGQLQNENWFQFRSGRVTASYFGEVKNRRCSTPPDRLVRVIFQYSKRHMSPPQCLEGKLLEPAIREKYILHQTKMGHAGLMVEEKGLVIDKTNPLIAASVDGEVKDPTARHNTTGNLEMKYKQFPTKLEGFIDPEKPELISILANNTKGFCLENKNGILKLRTNHNYFAQIQWGMGVTGQPWST